MKNIVVLDAHTLSPLPPGEHSPFHPNWDAIAALGPLQLYPRSNPDEVVTRARHAQILLTNKTVVSAEHINALPELEYIGVMATGYNVVDLDAARARGIPVTNIPGYGTASVAQHVFALLLELSARVGATDAAVKNGDWVRCPDFCFTVVPFVELAGKTLGIVGYGTIGQAVARIASAFGMHILATARSPKSTETPVEWVSLDELFRRSDVVTLHCPLTEETRHVINSDSLARMKSSAFLINTGRGPLIDEEALAAALKKGVIAGFGADVLSSEPPARTNPLLSAPRTVITPHIAWASVEARSRLMGILAKNILDFLAGSPANVVNSVGAGGAAHGLTTAAAATPEEVPPPESASHDPAAPVHPGHEPAPKEPTVENVPLEDSPAVGTPFESDTATPAPSPSESAEVPATPTVTEIPSLAPVGDLLPVGPEALGPVPPEAGAPPETGLEEQGPSKPIFPEPPQTFPQEAIAESLAAADSTTPETSAEFAGREEALPVQPFVPEALSADPVSQETTEIAPTFGNGVAEGAPLLQEAVAESLAAADSTTPETSPEVTTPEQTVPAQASAPEVAPEASGAGESVESQWEDPSAPQDHPVPSPPSTEAPSQTETVEEDQVGRRPNDW